MLSIFRRGIWSKIMLVILAIGLFAIVITGFGTGGMGGIGGFGGMGGTTLASVDGEDVTEAEARSQVQRQLDRARQQQPELDIATFLGGGALEEIVKQLTDAAAMRLFAARQGLVATRAMVDREILGIPGFQNLAGQFDDAVFRRALTQEKISEEELRRELADSLVQRQLMLPVASSSFVPRGLAIQYASLLLERRSGTVGIVPTEAMGAGVEPSSAEIAVFYRENRARYTVPERRVVRYAPFGPAQVAQASQATEAEIADLYRSEAATFAARETRNLSQVVFPDEAAARAFAAKIATGTSFAAAASQAGFAPADTARPDQTRDGFARLSSAAVAAAAFSAAQGTVTAPVRSPLGWSIVRVDGITKIPARPLAAVRGELAARIGADKSRNALADLATRIDRAISDGSSIEEIVQAERLTLVESPLVTAAGADPANLAYRAPPELMPLLEGAFDMEEGDDPAVESIVPDQVFALVGVGRVIAAAPPPLAEIAARVKGDLIARRAAERARAVASALVARINAGTAPAAAFAGADVSLSAPQRITAARRDIARQDRPVPPPLAMLFSLPRGKARLLPAPQGSGWFVVHLDEVVPGDAAREPAMIDAIRSEFARVLGDEYARQFTVALQGGMEVERNPEAVTGLRNQLSGGAQ